MEKSVITAEEITRLKTVSNTRISPNGRQVAFVLNTVSTYDEGVGSSIWLADIEGKASYRLKGEFKEVREPIWSPDGDCIAFISKDNQCKLCFTDKRGNLESTMELPKGSHNIEWSPDGCFISFLCKAPKGKSDILVAGQDDQGTGSIKSLHKAMQILNGLESQAGATAVT